ncbi:MAG: hypothetical protein K8F52_14385 [Candidatus Scalindua rubra]|nr:hypothetical protein [Candidatus Scalindua rubra]
MSKLAGSGLPARHIFLAGCLNLNVQVQSELLNLLKAETTGMTDTMANLLFFFI